MREGGREGGREREGEREGGRKDMCSGNKISTEVRGCTYVYSERAQRYGK